MKTKKSNDDDETHVHEEDVNAIYVYVGDGLGIPGLPHRLSRAEAERQQVLKAFEHAISVGAYVLETDTAPGPEKE